MERVYAITTEGEEALGAATAETLLQLRGSTSCYARLVRWGVSFDGVTSTDAPAVVRLLFQSTDGTASAATEVAINANNAVSATCTGFHSFSAEPTASSVIETHEVHPQGGAVNVEYPNDATAPTLANAATSRIAIEVTSPTAVNAVAYLHFAE